MNTPLRWLAYGSIILALSVCNILIAQNPSHSSITKSASVEPVFAQLEFPLSAEAAAELKAQNIRILHHYGEGKYLLSALPRQAKKLDQEAAAFAKTQAVGVLDVYPELAEIFYPKENARSQPNIKRYEVDLRLAYVGAAEQVEQVLAKAGFQATGIQIQDGLSLRGSIGADQLVEILQHPLILDASPYLGEDQPFNFEGRVAHNVTPLNSGIAGASHLNGSGVVIGIGDGGAISSHPDIGNRVLYSTTYYNSGWGTHPDMVAGIVGGAGIINPLYRGTASEAEFIIEASSTITFMAPSYRQQYGMTITNNSYGPTFHCNTANKYYSTSSSIDQQLYDNPSLMHVYAAGNSGRTSCNNLPVRYGSIPGGPQVAKNTLTVGNAYFSRQIFTSSSAGPTFDGRLKPELTAIGAYVTSNDRQQGYGTGSGTSFSSPAVAAILSLLTEHYSALNTGQKPDGALLKAIACNTAEDLGRPGPDYEYGFGMISGTRALEAISQQNYLQADLAPGVSFTKDLTVSPGTELLKIMLYWPDQAGPTTNTGSTLINNFDLYVLTPVGDTLRPWVLTPSDPLLNAFQGIDQLNNIEQVTLAQPASGIYRVVVKGTNLPYGSSDFVLTWQFPQPAVQLTCPFGGETILPDAQTYIAWEASPGQTGTWHVEYALAQAPLAGTTWTSIAAGIPNNSRSILWTPPSTPDAYVVRITNESSGVTDATDAPIAILGSPAGLHADPVCNGDMRLAWQPVAGAVSYEVFRFDGNSMVSEGQSSDTLAFVSNLMANQQSLFSVRALGANAVQGQRAYAIMQTSSVNGFGCYSPLPVEWTDIYSEEMSSAVRVHWSVASEYNNDYFELLRGMPKGDSLSWVAVARVAGRGTTGEAGNFEADDSEAPRSGTIYYRVRQIDFNGDSKLSTVVAHQRQTLSIKENAEQVITLSQNPVYNDIQLTINDSKAAQLDLFDLAGRRVHSFSAQPGVNVLPWPTHLSRGMYLLRVAGQGDATALKIVRG